MYLENGSREVEVYLWHFAAVKTHRKQLLTIPVLRTCFNEDISADTVCLSFSFFLSLPLVYYLFSILCWDSTSVVHNTLVKNRI